MSEQIFVIQPDPDFAAAEAVARAERIAAGELFRAQVARENERAFLLAQQIARAELEDNAERLRKV